MKNKVFLMVGLLAFVVIMVVAMVLYEKLGSEADNGPVIVENSETVDAASGTEEESVADSESQDMSAPDFTVYDKDGNPVKLSDFTGKPVILNFWASWCGPCKNEMPDFDEAYKEYGDEIHFLMVNQTDGQQETVASASAFIEDAGYSFPVYFDSDLHAASVYGISAIPMTFFIDADGNMAAYAQGMISAEGLAQGISMILK